MDLREKILSMQDLKREWVEVPEWGVTIEAREFNGLVRQRFFSLVRAAEGEQIDILRYHAAAVVLGAYDPEGGPIFDQSAEAIEGEIHEVTQKSTGAIFPLAARILELSGIGKKAEADTEKNSGGDAPSG